MAVSAPVTHALSPTTVLRDWAGIDIAARLHERTGFPIHVGNDANLGALAEWRLGAGQGVDDLVYIMLSDGVGAGLVLGGRLYEGGTGGAGELVALAERDHPGAQRVLTDAGRSVGQALAGPCTVLDPRLIIPGGKNARASAPLIQGIHDALSRMLPPLNNRSIRVVVGQLGDRAELLGALTIAGTGAVTRLLQDHDDQ